MDETFKKFLGEERGMLSGKYVALRSFRDNTVISYGSDPSAVYNKAKKKGIRNPVLIYVPKKGITHIY